MCTPFRFALVATASLVLALPAAQRAAAAEPARTANPPKQMPANPFQLTPEQRAEYQRNQELAAVDRARMMRLLGITEPALPPMADDPKRPAHTTPVPGNAWNWTDGVPGHTYVRSAWGNWLNYDLTKADTGELPDPLRLNDGGRVTDAETWWTRRRPEVLEEFQREIYGRIPAQTPAVTWQVVGEDRVLDGIATETRLIGRIDNSAYPAATPELGLKLYLPVKRYGPVPVIVGLTWVIGGRELFDETVLRLVLARGWGFAKYNPTTVQADTGGGLDRGIIGLVNRGQPRKPDDWGAIAAWTWGLSRIIDHLERDPRVDAKRLGVQGHSRYGKTALVAAAYDPRWAVVYCSCSGEGGAKLHRHDFGESADLVCGTSEYHWMAGNFLKYGGRPNSIPVDQHELIALVAPRPVFVTGGTEDLWADPVGEFKACVGAGPVYRLLGTRDLGTTEMPRPDEALIAGELGFREHVGGHTDLPDWPVFLDFAARHFSAVARSTP